VIAGGTALAWLFALAEPPRDSPREAAASAPAAAPRSGAAPDDQAAVPAIVLSVREIVDDVLDERVIAAVRAHTRALGVRLAIVRHAAPLDPATLADAGQALAQREAALGVLWIDVAADGAAVLYLDRHGYADERRGDRRQRRRRLELELELEQRRPAQARRRHAGHDRRRDERL